MTDLKRVFTGLAPLTAFDAWTFVVFVAAVVELFLLRGLDGGVLALFLIPPAIAFLFKQLSTSRGPRIVAICFLSAVSLGEILRFCPKLLPNLGGVDARLPREQDRILTWYTFNYLLFLCAVVPLFVFIRGLVDHAHGRPAQLSKFTCRLGLLATLLVGPVMIQVCVTAFRFLPLLGK